MTLLDGSSAPVSIRQRADRLHEFFENSVDRSPGAIAVQDGLDQITYAELEQRANQLAHHLRRRGAGLGSRIGIVLVRSAYTYVALLGVTKSGATFVPIDPAAPVDRIAYIAEDAALDLLITSEDLVAGLAELPCDLLPIDGAAEEIAGQPTYRVGDAAEGDVLAVSRGSGGSDRVLRHLHVRLQRSTQGRRRLTEKHLQLHQRGDRHLRRPFHGPCLPGYDHLLRLLHRGDLAHLCRRSDARRRPDRLPPPRGGARRLPRPSAGHGALLCAHAAGHDLARPTSGP